jgi:hypothetical protein
MGLIITEGYWKNFPIREFTDEELTRYSLDWQMVLSHPNVALLKSEVVETAGVLIVRQPIRVRAASDYGGVVFIQASFSNPDFTELWRTIPLSPKTDEEKQALKKFKARMGLIVAEIILPKWFPDMIGVENGLNVWPIRLDGAFIVVPA